MIFHGNSDALEKHNCDADGMSLLDKMSMWDSKAGENHSSVPKEDLFEGVEDDEGENVGHIDLSAYSKVVLKSTAYEWLIFNLRKESSLRWSSHSEMRDSTAIDIIRRKILEKLPSGKISKARPPRTHNVAFRLQWCPPYKRLYNGRAKRETTNGKAILESIAVTCCSNEAQATSVQQYMSQTWPSNWKKFLELLRCVADSTDEVAYTSEPFDKKR